MKQSVRASQILAAAFTVVAPQEGASQDDEDGASASLEVAYTADAWTLVSGDGEGEVRYLDNLDVILNGDLERIAGVSNTTYSVYGLYNNGAVFSGDIVRDTLSVSNIEAPVEAFRIYEAWIEHRPGGGPFSARLGLYDVNAEFDALETSSFFIGSAHGIGADVSQSGVTGPSIFPITSLGLRLDYEVSGSFKIRAAVLDGVAGDPQNPKKTTVKLSERDGALIIAETDFQRGPFRALGGAWRYTSPLDRHDGQGQSASQGVYLRGETTFFQREARPGKLAGFVRAGLASGAVNEFSEFYAAGLVYEGVLHIDGRDQLGIAVAHASASEEFLTVTPGYASHETVLEVSYRTEITDWLAIQPNLQYIIHPGLEAGRRNALAIGVRTEFGLISSLLSLRQRHHLN